eukprot:1160839-Pelagomonas_calceolata.AAC.1
MTSSSLKKGKGRQEKNKKLCQPKKPRAMKTVSLTSKLKKISPQVLQALTRHSWPWRRPETEEMKRKENYAGSENTPHIS